MKLLSAEEWAAKKAEISTIFSAEKIEELIKVADVPLPPDNVRIKFQYEDQFCKVPGKPDPKNPNDCRLFAEVSRIEALGYMLNSAAEKAEFISRIDVQLHQRSPKNIAKTLNKLTTACATIQTAYADSELRRLLENSAARCAQTQSDIRAATQQEISALVIEECKKRTEALDFAAETDGRKQAVAAVDIIKVKRKALEAEMPLTYDQILYLPGTAAVSGVIILQQAIKALENLSHWADVVAKKAEEPDSLKEEWFEGKAGSRGTMPEFEVQRFVGSLCEIWREVFDREPKTSITEKGANGPFVRFVVAALSAIKIDKSNDAVRGIIRRHLEHG